MTFRELDSPYKELKGMSDKNLEKKRNMDIYVVTAIDYQDPKTGLISDYKCSIKSLTTKKQYDNVPMLGMGLGHYKGILKYPNVDDMVLVGFFDYTPTPVVLGTLFDYFTQSRDTVPPIKLNELLFTNKTFGSVLYFLDDNSIVLKASDPVDGDFKDDLLLKRAEIKLYPGTGITPGSISINTDGAITEAVGLALTQTIGGAWTVVVGGIATLTTTGAVNIEQAVTGAGFFIDALGNVTIKGKTINFVQV